MAETWKSLHYWAVREPEGLEVIGRMCSDWAEYGLEHHERYESRLADDYVLGPAWAKIGEGLLALLNGDLGRLDGGSLDGMIRMALQAQGFDPDTLEVVPEDEIPNLESEDGE